MDTPTHSLASLAPHVEAYLATRNAIPRLKMGSQTLASLEAPNELKSKLYASDALKDTGSLLHTGLYAIFAIPLTQLQSLKNQRPLIPSHAKQLCHAFGDNPVAHMHSNMAVVIPNNLEKWPTLPDGHDRHEVMFLDCPEAIADIADGQHRVSGSGEWCEHNGIDKKEGFWLCQVLHPSKLFISFMSLLLIFL
jgi:hypothetical protein